MNMLKHGGRRVSMARSGEQGCQVGAVDLVGGFLLEGILLLVGLCAAAGIVVALYTAGLPSNLHVAGRYSTLSTHLVGNYSQYGLKSGEHERHSRSVTFWWPSHLDSSSTFCGGKASLEDYVVMLATGFASLPPLIFLVAFVGLYWRPASPLLKSTPRSTLARQSTPRSLKAINGDLFADKRLGPPRTPYSMMRHAAEMNAQPLEMSWRMWKGGKVEVLAASPPVYEIRHRGITFAL